MAKRNIFNRVPVRRVKRAGFDLSSKILTTMVMGKLYPVGTPILAIPGDKHKLGHQVVAHAMPMGSPAFADITMYFLDFFVPFRILYPDIDEHLFERFIANEPLDNGETAVLPRMNSTDIKGLRTIPTPQEQAGNAYSTYDSLWDYFGFQTGVKPQGLSAPLDAPWRAYWLIYNEYIRDEKLQDSVDWAEFASSSGQYLPDIVRPAYVNYARDYLTSAFLSPQQGEAVSIPLSGYAPIVGDYQIFNDDIAQVQGVGFEYSTIKKATVGNIVSDGSSSTASVNSKNLNIHTDEFEEAQRAKSEELFPNRNFVVNTDALHADLSQASTYDINDLRLANALQRWKEINNKCGTRYAEFLRAQYGVAPRDERLQRPEFIGGTKCPIIVSQVLQTSNSDAQQSPTGFKYGQGMAVDSDYSGTYFVKEFGLIMTLAYIRPKTLYQDGITREWTPETYLDFMNPLYVGLGEQGIKNSEVFAVDSETENRKIWGYQSMYQELRYRSDRVTGKMRSNITGDMNNSFDYWHLGRHFQSLPQLNAEFIKCNPSTRIFQAGDTEIQFICEIGNSVKSLRPLPYYAIPRF